MKKCWINSTHIWYQIDLLSEFVSKIGPAGSNPIIAPMPTIRNIEQSLPNIVAMILYFDLEWKQFFKHTRGIIFSFLVSVFWMFCFHMSRHSTNMGSHSMTNTNRITRMHIFSFSIFVQLIEKMISMIGHNT